ncbi:MAG: ferritin family protein [Desulfobacterium sp.]|jgi:rubrerythrin|nr:ferritin family protein [Desulfobacterium sp.]
MDAAIFKKIVDMAIANEIEAWEFYQAASEKIKEPHLKEMFQGFAREEKGHELLLRNLLSRGTMSLNFKETTDYKVAETVDEPRLSMDMKPADAIALAMKKEERAMKEYNWLAEQCEDAAQKKVFLDLAAMERGHKLQLEEMFVDIGYPEVW